MIKTPVLFLALGGILWYSKGSEVLSWTTKGEDAMTKELVFHYLSIWFPNHYQEISDYFDHVEYLNNVNYWNQFENKEDVVSDFTEYLEVIYQY